MKHPKQTYSRSYIAALLLNWHKLRTKPEHVNLYVTRSTWPDGRRKVTLNFTSEGRDGALLSIILDEAEREELVDELSAW